MRPILLAAGALLGLASIPSGAQSRLLTDRDFEIAEAFLRLQAARRENAAVVMAERDSYFEEGAKAAQSVIDGHADALATGKRLQPALLPPPGGTYDAACSRAASLTWYPALAVAYTFGVVADDVGRKLLAGDSTAARALIEESLGATASSPARQRVRALMDRVRASYESKGYREHPMFATFYSWALDGPGGLVMMASVNQWYNGGCRHLSDGPTLVILPRGNLSETHRASERRGNNIADQWAATLERFRITEDQWAALRMDVMLAHDDAHATQPIDANIDPVLRAHVAESIAKRKQNAAAYRRHAARLDPIVAATKIELP